MALRKPMNSWCRWRLHVAAYDGAVEEQPGGAMPLVVVGHGPARLGAVEGLDLALLID
jgi:hypothetical protein